MQHLILIVIICLLQDCGTKQSLSSNRFGVLGFGVLRRAQVNLSIKLVYTVKPLITNKS